MSIDGPLPKGDTVFTVGHSRHRLEHFIELLQGVTIETVVDTRGQPYSRYNPQFNRESLVRSLHAANLAYLWRGEVLSGRPHAGKFYVRAGVVDWERLRTSEEFQIGMAEIVERARHERTAIICAEEDPNRCHRRFLLTPPMVEAGLNVMHIRGDGAVQSEDELRCNEGRQNHQMPLFE